MLYPVYKVGRSAYHAGNNAQYSCDVRAEEIRQRRAREDMQRYEEQRERNQKTADNVLRGEL